MDAAKIKGSMSSGQLAAIFVSAYLLCGFVMGLSYYWPGPLESRIGHRIGERRYCLCWSVFWKAAKFTLLIRIAEKCWEECRKFMERGRRSRQRAGGDAVEASSDNSNCGWGGWARRTTPVEP